MVTTVSPDPGTAIQTSRCQSVSWRGTPQSPVCMSTVKVGYKKNWDITKLYHNSKCVAGRAKLPFTDTVTTMRYNKFI